jgi:WD40 repeat protein
VEPTVLACPSCRRRYRPHPYDPAQTYSCKQCNGSLVSESAAPAPVREQVQVVPIPRSPVRRPKVKARSRRTPILVGTTAVLLLAGATLVVVRAVQSKEAAIAVADRAAKAEKEAERLALESRREAQAAARERDAAKLRLAESLVFQGDVLGSAGRWGEAHDLGYVEARKIYRDVGSPSRAVELGFSRIVRHQPPPLIAFAGHSKRVDAVTFAPEGGLVASGSADGTVGLWDALTGRRLRLLEQGSGVTSLAFSPDGRRLGSASVNGEIRMWDAEDGRGLWSLRVHQGAVRSVAFSWDGETLLSAGADGAVRLTGAESGEFIMEWIVEEDVSHAAFFPAEDAVFYGGTDGGSHRLECETGESRRIAEGGAGTRTPVPFALAPDGRVALSGARGFDLESGEEIVDHPAHAAGAIGVAVSPDGRLAVTVDGSRAVKVWELRHGRDVRSYDWHDAGAACAAFSPDGRWVVSGGVDGSLHLWEVTVAAFDPDRLQEVRARMLKAQATLATSPGDGPSLRDLSDGWRFRGFGEAAARLAPEAGSSSARAPRR